MVSGALEVIEGLRLIYLLPLYGPDQLAADYLYPSGRQVGGRKQALPPLLFPENIIRPYWAMFIAKTRRSKRHPLQF